MIDVRAKGQRGEREIVHLLQEIMDTAHGNVGSTKIPLISRNLEQTRDGGYDIGIYEYCVEVKRVEKPNLTAFWKQACKQAARVEGVPVLAWRLNGGSWTFKILVPILIGNSPVDTAVDMDIATFKAYLVKQIELKLRDRKIDQVLGEDGWSPPVAKAVPIQEK